MNILSPSILAADFSKLGEEIKAVDEAGAPYIHFDVMDGVFVPSISFGMPILKSVRKMTGKLLDVHLMIIEPERYLSEFVKCGADLLTIHLETLKEPQKALQQIHELGIKAGIAINPKTPIDEVLPYLNDVDMVLVMTVQPGFGGQTYIDYCTDKVKKLYNVIRERDLKVDIEVDGGIGDQNIHTVLDAGANVIVMGSAVFGKNTAERAEHFVEILK